jgi:ankyrin repeat protein
MIPHSRVSMYTIHLPSTALMEMISADDINTIQMLLERKADVNVALADGTSALSVACDDGKFHLVKLLLEKGADVKVHMKPHIKKLTLMLASKHGLLRTVQQLVAMRADLNVRSSRANAQLTDGAKEGHSAVQRACWFGQTAVVKCLIDADAKIRKNFRAATICRETALIIAAERGNTACVRLLLDAKVDVNVRALRCKHSALHRACAGGHTRTAEALVQYSADVNARDASGQSTLAYALMKGAVGCVQLLMNAGAEGGSENAATAAVAFTIAMQVCWCVCSV